MTGELVKIAADTLNKAQRTVHRAKISLAKGNQALMKKLVEELANALELLKKACHQAQAVISGNRHIKDRLVSIHDPEARPIRKGKSGKPVQFGRKLLLTANEQGFITSHKMYQGNPNDKTLFQEGVQGHRRNVEKPAKEAATDRGFYAPTNDCLEHILLQPDHGATAKKPDKL